MAKSAWEGVTPISAKKIEGKDKGVLANAAGALLGHLPGGPDEETVAANARGVTDMLNPATLFGAVAGAGLKTIKAPLGTVAAAVSGGKEEDLKRLDQSALSFLMDTENVRKQQEMYTRGHEGPTGIAEKLNAILGSVAPVAQDISGAIAGTGIRGGGAVASGISQTGAFGPRQTPNQILENMNLKDVESYGQAANRGGAGAMLLGDILNVAPAMKGATGGGALNPLAETAAAQKIAQAGGFIEKAPLIPAQKGYQGLQTAMERASGGHVAFPQLAEAAAGAENMGIIGKAASKLPGIEALSAKAEKAAGFGAQVNEGFVQRAELMNQEALLNATPDMKAAQAEMTTQINAAAAAGNDELVGQLLTEKKAFENAAKHEASQEAAFQMARRGEELSQKYGPGAETVPSDAFGRIMNDVEGVFEGGPGKYEGQIHGLTPMAKPGAQSMSIAEEFPKDAKLVEDFFAQREKLIEANPGINIDSLMQADKYLKAKELIAKKFPDIDSATAALRNEDKLAPIAVRNIPKGWTEESMANAWKGLDSPALPKGIAGDALKGWDTMMNAWKTMVLPVKPSWHTGNIVGNAMSAMLIGEVDPFWAMKNMKSVWEEMKKPDSMFLQSRGRGIGAEAASDLSLIRKPGEGALKHTAKQGIAKSYEAAQTVDDFTHTAIAMNRYDKNLAAGMSSEAAAREANAFSLKSAGDFGNMSAMERSFLRRVMPFYPWMKHTAKTTIRFPLENPGRFLQSQALAPRLAGQMGVAQGGPEGADYLAGAIPLAGGRFLTPKGDIGLGIGNNPLLNPTEIFSGAAPPIQALGALGGLNLSQGRELQTQPGQNRLSAAAGYTMNQMGALKSLADAVAYAKGEGNYKLSDTRGIMTEGGRVKGKTSSLDAGPIPAPLLSFLGVGNVTEPDKKSGKNAQKAQKTEAKKVKTYEKAVTKKPKE